MDLSLDKLRNLRLNVSKIALPHPPGTSSFWFLVLIAKPTEQALPRLIPSFLIPRLWHHLSVPVILPPAPLCATRAPTCSPWADANTAQDQVVRVSLSCSCWDTRGGGGGGVEDDVGGTGHQSGKLVPFSASFSSSGLPQAASNSPELK